MVLGDELGHPFEVRQENVGLVIPWVTTRNKNRIEPFDFAVVSLLLLQKLDFLSFVGQFDQHGNPDPMVKVVLVAKFCKFKVHFVASVFHQRTGLLFLPRNIFDSVCPKNGHLAEILVVLIERPCVPAIRGVSIANLMTSNRPIRRFVGFEMIGNRDFILLPIKIAKQLSNSEHRTTRIDTGDDHGGRLTTRRWKHTNRKRFRLLRNCK